MKVETHVAFVGWLFIAAGTVGFVYHAPELNTANGIDYEVVWELVVRLLAILGGAFVLRGAIWARRLVLAWMAYHVVLSAFHSWTATVVHAVLLLGIAYVLLRRTS